MQAHSACPDNVQIKGVFGNMMIPVLIDQTRKRAGSSVIRQKACAAVVVLQYLHPKNVELLKAQFSEDLMKQLTGIFNLVLHAGDFTLQATLVDLLWRISLGFIYQIAPSFSCFCRKENALNMC